MRLCEELPCLHFTGAGFCGSAMTDDLLSEIPYHACSAELFGKLAGRPWAIFLDSGRPFSHQGRYDIIAADPLATLVTRGEVTEVRSGGGVELSPEDPFELLRRSLLPWMEPIAGLPFVGGALGYFAYDLGRRIERLAEVAEESDNLPDMAVGIYDWALVVDHETRRSWLASPGRSARTCGQWPDLVRRFSSPPAANPPSDFRVISEVRSNMSKQEYGTGFSRIQRYIHDGDCYQVNFAQRFSVRAEGAPWHAYRTLREVNAAPFAAYLNLPWGQILSASPERFLQVRCGRVETKPIKGTCPRGTNPIEDRALAEGLYNSVKDRAENLMIVDLLRNDLGKTCSVGSVRVPQLWAVESFATVHHLVSTVTGELADDRDALHLLRGCFPGGSITGAPKLRAMQIIEELEPHRRGVYCGSIGYVGFDGAMDASIAIRTMIHGNGEMRFWAGGGIVADSTVQAEYKETFDKVAAMFALFQRARVERVGS
jgi:para-aminobenzoate synthetase component 1